jgi:hypothetical protein
METIRKILMLGIIIIVVSFAFIGMIAIVRSEPVDPPMTEQTQPEEPILKDEPTPPGMVRIFKGAFEIPCAKRPDMVRMIESQGLVPAFISQPTNGEGFILFVNNETQMWTMVSFSNKRDLACFVAIGTGYKLNPAERKASL